MGRFVNGQIDPRRCREIADHYRGMRKRGIEAGDAAHFVGSEFGLTAGDVMELVKRYPAVEDKT